MLLLNSELAPIVTSPREYIAPPGALDVTWFALNFAFAPTSTPPEAYIAPPPIPLALYAMLFINSALSAICNATLEYIAPPPYVALLFTK